MNHQRSGHALCGLPPDARRAVPDQREHPPLILPVPSGRRRPSPRIAAKAVAAFLAGNGPVTRRGTSSITVLKGFFRFAVSRGHLDEGPAADRSSRSAPRASSRTSTPGTRSAGCWTRSRRTGATALESNRRPSGRSCCCCTGPGCGAARR